MKVLRSLGLLLLLGLVIIAINGDLPEIWDSVQRSFSDWINEGRQR